mmetsp:Transcript_12521/g.38239  ORF Transcript_12521/g.38239 Transcript_12521/m.38239 type:complete len:210 (-) Transcript_12521:359-988(-)
MQSVTERFSPMKKRALVLVQKPLDLLQNGEQLRLRLLCLHDRPPKAPKPGLTQLSLHSEVSFDDPLQLRLLGEQVSLVRELLFDLQHYLKRLKLEPATNLKHWKGPGVVLLQVPSGLSSVTLQIHLLEPIWDLLLLQVQLYSVTVGAPVGSVPVEDELDVILALPKQAYAVSLPRRRGARLAVHVVGVEKVVGDLECQILPRRCCRLRL